jgi:hypothetical protein
MYPLYTNDLYASAVDILKPEYHKYPLFKQAKGFNVTISKGDLLYTPAFWWHQVASEGRNVAVNYFFQPHSLLLHSFYIGVKEKIPSVPEQYQECWFT